MKNEPIRNNKPKKPAKVIVFPQENVVLDWAIFNLPNETKDIDPEIKTAVDRIYWDLL